MKGAIWVFAGPSLPPGARPAHEAITWRPPATAGDGLAALEAGARVVALVDGLFGSHPAIRHKELLGLIEHGVRVIGGASMGALRAAEMHTCGMEGVGAIFRAYADGRLTRDDEVALAHGPQAMDWAPLTLPLVNIRATLARAVRERVMTAAAARRLRAIAADVFFADRTWASLAEAAHDEPDAARFFAWGPGAYVDLKQADARACVAAAVAGHGQPVRSRPQRPPTAFTAALAHQVSSARTPN